MKIIHIPKNVGGNPSLMSKFMNQAGLKSEIWVIQKNQYEYIADKFITSLEDYFLKREVKKILALSYIFKTDIVFYNFGACLFPPYFTLDYERYPLWKRPLAYLYTLYIRFMSIVELGLIRLLRVKIFMQYQGDDARQGDFIRSNFEINIADEVDKYYYSKKTDQMKKRQINLFGKIARKIYSLNPDLMHVLPQSAEFLPYMIEDLEKIEPSFINLNSEKLIIGHAPSNRDVKGTKFLLDAIDELKKKNDNFDFILIENLSHGEALKKYQQIDILVDQLLAGWYGGVAVEAMSFGKLVIAYLRESDLRFIPPEMKSELPIFNAEPRNIYSILHGVISMSREELYDLSIKSRNFVEKWHDPRVITDRLKSDFLSI